MIIIFFTFLARLRISWFCKVYGQTTTAGPEITTTTLTVPVYITGAIPASSWGGELTLTRSLSGTALPVILPARKISPNCQIPQRVLLGSIGSLAVPGRARTIPSTSSSLLKRSVITVPQSMVTMPKAKVSAAGDVKYSDGNARPLTDCMDSATLGGTTVQAGSVLPVRTTAINVAASRSLVLSASSAAGVSCEAGKPAKTTTEEVSSIKDSVRKISHDAMLHNTSMYDQTARDHTSAGDKV